MLDAPLTRVSGCGKEAMGSMGRHLSSDEGMTLVEILVAVTILFIVVTAMLPMLFQTTMMASQAKAQAAITNAVSSYIEDIRALPYDEIAIVGTEPGASVEPTRATAVDGYTVLMQASIDWVDDPDLFGTQNYKELTVDATATAAGKPSLTYTTSTFIWGSGESGSASIPLVMFTGSSPEGQEVVYGSVVLVGGHAEAISSGAQIAKLVLKVDSEYLPDASGSFAEFAPLETPTEQTWLWDTTAASMVVDEEGSPVLDAEGHVQYRYFSPDGRRVLKVQAWDTLGLTNYVTRVVVVDNYAPSPTSSANLAASQSTALTAAWDEAMDGTDPAAGYNIRLRKASTSASDPSSWVYTTTEVGAVTNAALAGTPFSRYFVQVQSESPRGLIDEDAWVDSSIVITRPELTGTTRQVVTKSGSSYHISATVTANVSDPTFATTGAVTYDLWRSTSLATLGTGSPYRSGVAFDGSSWSETITDGASYPKGATTPTYYYKVRATFTPYGDGSPVQAWTNVGVVSGATISGAGTIDGTIGMQW